MAETPTWITRRSWLTRWDRSIGREFLRVVFGPATTERRTRGIRDERDEKEENLAYGRIAHVIHPVGLGRVPAARRRAAAKAAGGPRGRAFRGRLV